MQKPKLIYEQLMDPVCGDADCDIKENPEHWVNVELSAEDLTAWRCGAGKEKDKVLRSARKWIREMPHDDSCSWLDNHSQHCDCGKVIEIERITKVLKPKR